MEADCARRGRWPVGRRLMAGSGDRGELGAKVRGLFLQWLEKVGDEKAKGIFWSMTAGKLQASPFEGSVEAYRLEMDRWLKEKGQKPDRRSTDRASEINFRRLHAALAVMEDEDYDYLQVMAETGRATWSGSGDATRSTGVLRRRRAGRWQAQRRSCMRSWPPTTLRRRRTVKIFRGKSWKRSARAPSSR